MHTVTKRLREFEEAFRGLGCCITGATNGVQIHHVKGRKFKHNKVLIGGHFILPLHYDLHMVTGAHPNAYHKNKRGFIEEFGQPRDLWLKCYTKVQDLYNIEESIINSIMDCRV